MGNRSSNLKQIKGAFFLTLSVIIVKIIGFVYKLPLSYVLGDEGMGYFNSAYTVFGFFYLLCTGGIPRAVSIMITEAEALGKKSEMNRILKISLNTFSIIGASLSAFILVFARQLSVAIGNKLSWFSLISIAPSLFFIAATGVLRGYLNGREKFGAIAVSGLAEGLIKFVFGLFFAFIAVKLGYDTPIISAFTILGVTLGSLAGCIVLYFSAFKDIYNNVEKRDKISLKYVLEKLFKIAMPLTLSSAVMGLSSVVDLWLIMRRLMSIGYSELEATALYGNYTTLVLPMLGLITALISPVCSVALPNMTSLYVQKDTEALKNKSCEYLRITAFFVIPLSVGFVFFSKELLMLLFDDASAQVAFPMLRLLAPSVAFIGLLTMSNTFLEATSDTKAALVSMSIGAVVKGIVSFILLGNAKISILGAPIGTTISYFVSLVISLLLVMRKGTFSFSGFFEIFKTLLFSFASILPARILYNRISENEFSVYMFIISVCLSVIIYIVLYFFDNLSRILFSKKMSNLTKNIG